jgi:ipoprotein LpqH
MKGNPVKRVLAAAIGLAASGTLLMACSANHASTTASTGAASTASATGGSGAPQVSAGGGSEVKVDGSDLAGLDPATVACVKQAGKINIASGAISGQQGLAVVMTDGTPPTVQSLGLFVDGSALAVSDNMGMKVGSADVTVDGSTYTITGNASGADMKNPMAGMISKPFTIKVTCS